jgi:uncharacterized protein (TIGR03437 family)
LLDLINAGSPLLVILSNGAAVNAIGINSDSSIAIDDPALAYTSLSGYLNAGATLTGVIRIVPTLSTPQAFVTTTSVSAIASSPSGVCANSVTVPGSGNFIECDGTQSIYELGFATQPGATVIDLAGTASLNIPASSAIAWQVSRVNGALTIAPQTIAITSVVSAASFAAPLSPGQIISIFGAGFIANSTLPTITINGQNVQLIAAFPYQINAILPAAIATGNATISVTSPVGSVSQTITLQSAAPGIFGIVNQDGTINTAANPVPRGSYISIYGTGLAATPAPTVSLNGTLLTPAYAGPAPGFTGLFQINVQVPATAVPGSAIALTVTQQSQTSNAVALAIE